MIDLEAIIRSEISNDPLGLGYAGLEPGAQSEIFNRRDRAGLRPSTIGIVRLWAAVSGVLVRLRDVADDTNETDEILRSACLWVMDSPDAAVFDPNDSRVAALIDKLHGAGIFGARRGDLDSTNDSRRKQLREIGGSLMSRAEELIGIDTVVDFRQITKAMR